MRLQNVRRIAVLRANGIGDLIFALPALASLKAAYPQASLTLLGSDWHADFLEGRGLVDEVVEVPRARAVLQDGAALASISDFLAGMRDRSFDVAVQIYGGGRYSNPFIKGLGAALSVGLRAPGAEPLDLSLHYEYLQSEVHRYLEVVGLIGARPVTFEPSLQAKPEDLAEVESLALSGGARVALNPGASDPRRRWPPERFAAVGDVLAASGGRVLIVGGQEDVDMAAAIEEQMLRTSVNLAGRLSLNGLAGLFSTCRLVISNDSGPLHLAAALGTPTVGMYWATNLVNAAPLTRRLHRPLVSWRMQCPVCGADIMKARCDHEASLVDEIGVEEVLSAAESLLAHPPGLEG
jgi:ADP-heptose:LPS heptosyltransferase